MNALYSPENPTIDYFKDAAEEIDDYINEHGFREGIVPDPLHILELELVLKAMKIKCIHLYKTVQLEATNHLILVDSSSDDETHKVCHGIFFGRLVGFNIRSFVTADTAYSDTIKFDMGLLAESVTSDQLRIMTPLDGASVVRPLSLIRES